MSRGILNGTVLRGIFEGIVDVYAGSGNLTVVEILRPRTHRRATRNDDEATSSIPATGFSKFPKVRNLRVTRTILTAARRVKHGGTMRSEGEVEERG